MKRPIRYCTSEIEPTNSLQIFKLLQWNESFQLEEKRNENEKMKDSNNYGDLLQNE